jgi:hypothetical protein
MILDCAPNHSFFWPNQSSRIETSAAQGRAWNTPRADELVRVGTTDYPAVPPLLDGGIEFRNTGRYRTGGHRAVQIHVQLTGVLNSCWHFLIH